ncbi:hypothetical protein CEE39_07490 [bacterium (candidate division B38) B3_B38]|nr:MAG: hypothetical protein CEE39_07490 [bacterium (candidate division B38) B3_B38]
MAGIPRQRVLTFIILMPLLLCGFLLRAQQFRDEENSHPCLAIPKSVKIDGNLAEWYGETAIELSSTGNLVGSSWAGATDLSARVWLAWDERFLYIACDLLDDQFQPQADDSRLWEGDSLWFKCLPPSSEQGTLRKGCRELILIFASTREGPAVKKLLNYGRGYFKAECQGIKFKVLPKESGMGAVYECALPWGELLYQPSYPPKVLNINLTVQDSDPGKELKSMEWVPSRGINMYNPLWKMVSLLPREEAPSPPPTSFLSSQANFSAVVHLVSLNVSVTDKNNRYISDLGPEDFTVLEDGKPQKIYSFSRQDKPITIALVIDSSGSMRADMEAVQESAINFVNAAVRLEDQVMVVEFDERINFLVDYTNNLQDIIDAINKVRADRGTALYDAVYSTIERLRFLPERKAVVLLSDGVDTKYFGGGPASTHTYLDVLEMAQRNDITIYTIGLRRSELLAEMVLRRWAKETGGRTYLLYDIKGLKNVYARIGEDLRSQYVICYSSTNKNWNGQWREVTVLTKRADLKAVTKKGYYAPLK